MNTLPTIPGKIDKRHWTFFYLTNGEPVYRPKKSIATEVEALEICFTKNLNPRSIHKSVAYKCPVCGAWHVGHNKTELTQEIREEISRKYKIFKIVHDRF